MGRFCDQCGKELLEGSVFCSYCGSPIGQQNRKNKKKWILPVGIGIAIVAVTAVGIVGFAFLTGSGRTVEKNMKLAEKHASAGEYEQALACYKQVLEMDSTMAEAYLGSAEVCLKAGDYEEAVNRLVKGQEIVDDAEKLAQKEDYIRSHVVLRRYWGYNPEGELCEEAEFEYDVNGNRTKAVYRKGSDRDIAFTEEVEYDEYGNMTQYTGLDDENGYYYYNEHKYDEKGNQTKLIHYDEERNMTGWYEYEYDENGNQTRKVSYDEKGEEESYTEYEYDDVGNQIWEIHHKGKGILEPYSQEYEYDDAGNQIKAILYDEQGEVKSWVESEYDEAGNCTKSTSYDWLGYVSYTADFEYECVLGKYYIRKWSYHDLDDGEEGMYEYEHEYAYIGE